MCLHLIFDNVYVCYGNDDDQVTHAQVSLETDVPYTHSAFYYPGLSHILEGILLISSSPLLQKSFYSSFVDSTVSTD